MKKNLKIAQSATAALGLLALLGTIPAHAADAVMAPEPMPSLPMEEPPLNTWTGPYAGISLGYGFGGDTDLDDGFVSNSIGTDGFLLGGFAGYNWQAGNIVAGAEADIGYSWVEGSNAGYNSDAGLEGSLRARLGYVVSPNILLYATAGGAAKDVEVSGGGFKDSNTMIGWTAGAGTDVMVTENIFGRVEYRYTDFGSDTFDLGSSTEVDAKDHRITFGVGMKF